MRGRTALLICAVAVLALVLPSLMPGRGDAPAAPPSATSTTYTCCSASDIETVRHPGETFEVHWTPVTETLPLMQQPKAITLAATLSGSYTSVGELKAAESTRTAGTGPAAPMTVTAPAVTVSSAGRATPVSVITIPRTAPPGFYDLTTSWTSGGASISGSSVIRVAAA